MKRRSRMLLGITVALLTAASLHFTVGDQFHRRFRSYRNADCGHRWKEHDRRHWNHENLKDPAPKDNSLQF